MSEMIDACVTGLNSIGRGFCTHAAGMFLQTTVLVAALFLLHVLLRKHVRASLRYWIWMLVFIKLLLPPSLSIPTGIGYWCGEYVPSSPSVPAQPVATAVPTRVSVELPALAEWSARQSSSPDGAAVVPEEVESVALRVKHLSWQGAVFALWIAGIFLFGVLLIQRLLFVRGLMAQGEPAGGDLVDALDRCRQRVAVRRKVGLLLSPNAFSPAVCGLLRPVILMPQKLPEGLPAHSLEAILIHELAHLKRGDIWVNCAQTILQIIYFYNPLVWLANVMVRRVREQAVDEMVLVALGAEARSYSRMLIDIAEMAFLRASPALRLLGVAESRKSLEGRIRHMMTRPMPKTARVGTCGLLAILTVAAVLLPMARAQDSARQDPAADNYSILLLDNTVSRDTGENRDDDRLYLFDSKGNITGVVSGFSISETIGGAHRLAVDDARKTLWVVENKGGRLRHFDLRNGKVLLTLPGLKADAAAVDPGSGNVWILASEGELGKGHIEVLSPSGQKLARHEISGFDIAYSRYDDCFWIVEKSVYKLDKKGTILGWIDGEIPWTAVSVSVDEKSGNAWVVVRGHSQTVDSKDELWIVDKNVHIQRRIDLGESVPFCVAVDSEHDVAWVGCGATTLRFSLAGERLKSARRIPGFSIVPGPSGNSVIAASQGGLDVVTVRDTGYVELGAPDRQIRDLLSLSQKWVARVPWSGAKLESSLEVGELPRTLADYPESRDRLDSLGKAVLMYANDYDDKLPDTLDDLRTFLSEADLRRLKDDVEYLGKGRTASDDPGVVLAYDKTVLREGEGTLVVYLDTHVSFESPATLQKLGIAPATDVGATSDLLANLFVMGSSQGAGDVFGAVVARAGEWTWNKTGRDHTKKSYDEIFNGTHNRTDHDVLVLLFALDQRDRIPAEYEDLLPQPWPQIEEQLKRGQVVELAGQARGLHVILLGAPRAEQLKEVIAGSGLLGNPQVLLGRSGKGSDVAVENFVVGAEPDRGTFWAVASIRNTGGAASPQFIVSFCRGDPPTAKPMIHGAGPVKPGETWNERSADFGLKEGVNEIHVALDPADLVEELDETNNRATLRVVIKDGQIAEQSLVRTPG